ncbi:Ubiquitin conjugation factor E4 [Dispira parvispora]|uniref:RING-type E3 ubiquitin transferase n=1 Tax=Dispira parvispora TaxID=1520584 RepID=A0A9W8AWM8_9FUNG|nr:Ubiquitin conjugation factor E4 [Dispira parvispora]
MATSSASPSSLSWQDNALSRILQVTLNPQHPKRQGYVYLAELVREWQTTNTQNHDNDPSLPSTSERTYPLLTADRIEEVVLSRLSYLATMTPDQVTEAKSHYPVLNANAFTYLLQCWKRAKDIRQGLLQRQANLDPQVLQSRLETVDQCSQYLISYAGITLNMPGMFPDCGGNPNEDIVAGVVEVMLKEDGFSPQGIPQLFWEEVTQRFDGDGLEEIVSQVVGQMGIGLNRDKSVFGKFRDYYRVMSELLNVKLLAVNLTRAPGWFDMLAGENASGKWSESTVPAEQLHIHTLFGPLFTPSAFPRDDPSILTTYFKDIRQRNRSDVESAMTSLRGTVDGIQRTLFQFTDTLVRANNGARQAVLEYVAMVISKNCNRGKMVVDDTQVSPDGFMWNWQMVLLLLCEPFLDSQASKIDRIDPLYLAKTTLLSLQDETKIKATEEEANTYFESMAGGSHPPANFITEIFYLTLAFQHLSLVPMYRGFITSLRELGEFRRQLDQLKEHMAEQPLEGTAALLHERYLERQQAEFDTMVSRKFATEAQLFNPKVLTVAGQFYTLTMKWLLRLVDPAQQYPLKPLSLPLPAQPPHKFTTLPEYFMSDVVDFVLGLLKYDTMMMLHMSLEDLVIFVVVFLDHSSYVKNPYLRANLVEILFFLTLEPPADAFPRLDFGAMLNTNPISLEYLAPALMRFYVEVEHTGASSQFYDKFNIRYNISQVLKYLRKNEDHRRQIQERSKDESFFIRFVNLLMNDTTYLLDESLTKLTEIRNLQQEMANVAEWSAQPDTYRRERQSLLIQDERMATSYLSLGNETLYMLGYLTEEVPLPFISPEIVERLAAMLNYNLQGMVGPKCMELKVKNPEKYHFRPRQLLCMILDVYLHLAHYPEFIRAVARDGRSYKKDWFLKAIKIVGSSGGFSSSNANVEALRKFVDQVETELRESQLEEEDLGEIPDEFLDPLTWSLMEEPVILPSSKVTLDLSTIKSHLLSDATDPFNRSSLTIDMVVPNTELKEKIREFKQSRSTTTKPV